MHTIHIYSMGPPNKQLNRTVCPGVGPGFSICPVAGTWKYKPQVPTDPFQLLVLSPHHPQIDTLHSLPSQHTMDPPVTGLRHLVYPSNWPWTQCTSSYLTHSHHTHACIVDPPLIGAWVPPTLYT